MIEKKNIYIFIGKKRENPIFTSLFFSIDKLKLLTSWQQRAEMKKKKEEGMKKMERMENMRKIYGILATNCIRDGNKKNEEKN